MIYAALMIVILLIVGSINYSSDGPVRPLNFVITIIGFIALLVCFAGFLHPYEEESRRLSVEYEEWKEKQRQYMEWLETQPRENWDKLSIKDWKYAQKNRLTTETLQKRA